MEQLNIGIPEMKIANLFEDIDILKVVQNLAIHIVDKDGGLVREENRKLRELVENKLTGRIEI